MESDSLLTKRQSNRIGEHIATTTSNTTGTMYSQSSSYNQRVTTTEPTSLRSVAYVDNPFDINILLIGRSQVGKSTLIESLTDPTFSSHRTGISQTREPTYKQLKMTGADRKEYTLNIIDTPGLREIRHDPNETRTDQQLLDLLHKVFNDGRIRALNVIGFVSEIGKTYQNDIDTFKSLINFFGPKFKPISALILTHCDKVSQETIDRVTRELKNHPVCAEVVNYCELGIHHHGTLDIDELETYTGELRERMRNLRLEYLKPMRDDLINFLLARSNRSIGFSQNDFKNFERKLVNPRYEAKDDEIYCCQCKCCACRYCLCECWFSSCWWPCWRCCKCEKLED